MNEPPLPTPNGDVPPAEKKPLWPRIKLAAIFLLVAVALIVVFQNREDASAKFLFATLRMPMAALLFLTFLLGAAVGVLVAYTRPWRKKR